MRAVRRVVVGPGRVGGSLAAALAAGGEEVELWGRSGRPPPTVAERPGLRYASGLPPAPGADGDRPIGTLVFAVPDDRLEAVATAWAAALEADPRPDVGSVPPPTGSDLDAPERAEDESFSVALHTSGSHTPAVLAPLSTMGFSVGGWHPLVPVAGVDPDVFRGGAVGVSGEAAAVERGRRLAEAVSARPLAVQEGSHGRYHAAAVLASNGLVACLAAARDELEAATGGAGSLDDLLPLARKALENVEERGLDGGLTGPVDRGDSGTVRRDLEGLPAERAELYRRLARELLGVVADRLPAERRQALRELLRG